MVSAPATILSLMLVSFSIRNGIGIFGFTNSEKRPVMIPFSTRTAPISIILSAIAENPVVSISKTTYFPLSGCPLLFCTIPFKSSTR